MTREDLSHAVLIPFLALYLLKKKWPALTDRAIEPAAWPGLGIVILSLAALLVGVAGGVITISSMSFIILLMGLTLMLLGPAHLRALSLPIAYLVFATPAPDAVVEPLHRPLQLLAAKVVSALFGIMGIPTYLDGTLIQFPNGILEVAVQCSGAGYLISVLAIGLPLALLTLQSRHYRVILIAGALLLSILVNWMRIALIGFVGYSTGWGPHVHGPFHMLQGLLVYWVGFAGLFAGAWLLARREKQRIVSEQPALTHEARSLAVPEWCKWRGSWWVAVTTLLIAALYLYGYDRGPVAAKQSFSTLPTTIGDWTAQDRVGHPAPLRMQEADQEFTRVYRHRDGSALLVYLAYLNSQTHGRELVNYLTTPLHEHVDRRSLHVGQAGYEVNVGRWQDGKNRIPLLFWYSIGSQSYADRYEAKAATIARALSHRGSNGALIVLSGINDRDIGPLSTERLIEFARLFAPLLDDQYMP
jgi:EpsI family protein